jgi:DeoR family transcriptional regulator, galactitol utilization operon repressor
MLAPLSEREKKILQFLTDDGTMSVSQMSRALNVSPVTVRADLNGLADKGVVVRTWGGAFPAFHPDIMERSRLMTDEKNRIAKKAASLVHDGDTIMVEAGTTTALVAKHLLGRRDVKIVTNSALVLRDARLNPALSVTLVGGEFKPPTESLVGPIALHELERFHVRIAFVGTDGFSVADGLTTHLVEGAEIVKQMARLAAETVVVADSSKYGKRGFVTVLPLTAATRIITDSALPQSALAELQEAGVAVELV